MNKTILEFSDIELKALAYDELMKFQVAQNNLKIINDELSRGANNSSEPVINQK